MSDVIRFLEQVGQDARLRHASAEELSPVLAASRIEPEWRDAILAGDTSELNRLAGQVPLFGMMIPAEDEEEEKQPDDDQEQAPQDDVE